MAANLIDTDETLSLSAPQPQRSGGAWGIAWAHPEERVDILAENSVTLGRSERANIVLRGPRVSRCHATLEKGPAGFVVSDCGSKNGVFVNGEQFSVHALAPGDVLRVGDWIGVLCPLSPPQVESRLPLTELGSGLLGGESLWHASQILRRAAPENVNVMLVGETGTGKELFARELHRRSGRSGKLVSVNCATIPEQLAEAELFGFRRGAFTGAHQDSLGHLRRAHRGTLFLDEVADLGSAVQVKMLRALEEHSVVPLGQSKSEEADARVVCAAQRPLHDYVELGRFRADLYARLGGVELFLAPLRQRREEIVPLFRRFLCAGAALDTVSFSTDFVECLCLYDWPLNVRQLVQLAARTRALHGPLLEAGTSLTSHHLPQEIVSGWPGVDSEAASSPPSAPASSAPVSGAPASSAPVSSAVPTGSSTLPPRASDRPRDQLAERLAQALHESQGNVSLAARRVGISRARAYRLLKRLPELDPEELRLKGLI